jgi:hypothetical protein
VTNKLKIQFSLCVVLGMPVLTSSLRAQQTTLTLSGSAIVFPVRTAADYDGGYVTATSVVTFTVAAPFLQVLTRTTTVSIHASSASLGGGKPIGDLEWRRGDLSTWTPITGSAVTVETRTLNPLLGTNNPWSNTIHFRIRLAWTAHGANAHAANYVITLSQTL